MVNGEGALLSTHTPDAEHFEWHRNGGEVGFSSVIDEEAGAKGWQESVESLVWASPLLDLAGASRFSQQHKGTTRPCH